MRRTTCGPSVRSCTDVGVRPTSRLSTNTLAPAGSERTFKRPAFQTGLPALPGALLGAASARRDSTGGFDGLGAGAAGRGGAGEAASGSTVLFATGGGAAAVVAAADFGAAATVPSVKSLLDAGALALLDGGSPRTPTAYPPAKPSVPPIARASTSGQTADRERWSIVNSAASGASVGSTASRRSDSVLSRADFLFSTPAP